MPVKLEPTGCAMAQPDKMATKDAGTQSSEEDRLDTGKCGICMELMFKPMTLTACGHTYCETCVPKITPRNCPECRQPFRTAVPVFIVGNLLAALYPEEYKDYVYKQTLDGRCKAMEEDYDAVIKISCDKEVATSALELLETFGQGDTQKAMGVVEEMKAKYPQSAITALIMAGTGMTPTLSDTESVITMKTESAFLVMWAKESDATHQIVSYQTGFPKSLVRGIKRQRLQPPYYNQDPADYVPETDLEEEEYMRPLTPAYSPLSPNYTPYAT